MDLSVIIPSRNEMFLQRTIQDILDNIEGDTEIIAILDGYWPDPGIPDHPKVALIHHTESVGQRAGINEGVRLSQAKYVMKCDAHCAFDKGFDVKLLADMHNDWTVVPTMRNLHAFDWVCEDGHRRYQSPSGLEEKSDGQPSTIGKCAVCGKPTTMDIVWIAKTSPQSNSYCFDSEPHFQYFNEFNKRPEGKGDLTETMSLQGSCFMMDRNRFRKLSVCDESFGSWGSQGIEVAVKSWLSGGKVMVNHKTWYAHMFRTQGGDFGFPYELSGRQVQNAKNMAKELLYKGFKHQIHPTSWLIEKFYPVRGWTDEDIQKLKEMEKKWK